MCRIQRISWQCGMQISICFTNSSTNFLIVHTSVVSSCCVFWLPFLSVPEQATSFQHFTSTLSLSSSVDNLLSSFRIASLFSTPQQDPDPSPCAQVRGTNFGQGFFFIDVHIWVLFVITAHCFTHYEHVALLHNINGLCK
jgi:hypothetical protein